MRSSDFFSFIAILVTTCPALAASSRWDAFTRDFRGVCVGEGDVAYVMNPEGGLAQVRLESGIVGWRTDRVARPLTVVDDRLLGQADPPRDGVLALAIVDVRTGEVTAELTLDLPDALTATIEDLAGQSFELRATRAGGDVLVRWEATRRPITGLPGRAVPKTSRGAYRVDVARGRATAIDGDTTESRPPGVPDVAWSAGPVFAATGRNRASCLVLRRWDAITGAARAELTLECAPVAAVSVATDGRHVLVGRRADAPTSARPYVWTVHAAETGARVGSVPGESPAEPFVVRGTDLLYEAGASGRLVDGAWTDSPPSLRAVDLRTGRARWSVAIRDTRYRGPLPRSGAAVPPRIDGSSTTTERVP